MSTQPAVSVVIPAHNEEPNLLPLVDRLVDTLAGLGRSFEVVIVDDASTDGSVRLLRNLCANESRLKAVCLRRNSGLPELPRIELKMLQAPEASAAARSLAAILKRETIARVGGG